MGQGSSSPVARTPTPSLYGFPAGETPESRFAKYLEDYRKKLRAPGAGMEFADFRFVKLQDVIDEEAVPLPPLLSVMNELPGSSPTYCCYFMPVTKKQANLKLGGIYLPVCGDAARARHILDGLTDDELDEVIDDGYDGDDGLMVPVFDEEGRQYDFRLGYSEDAFGGSFVLVGAGGDYQRFMENNNVVRDVHELGKDVSLLAFTFRTQAPLVKYKHKKDDSTSCTLCMAIVLR
uniref:Uncharacterized protein n=1 Tax=Leersia perrieri TaxID=77586 RepID=A0A0D9WG31_9ORYZ